jgi:transcription initiation factor TFIID subunit 15
VQVTLRNSQSGQAIDDNEVRRKFQQFGDVKAVKPVGDRIELRSFYPHYQDTFSDAFI